MNQVLVPPLQPGTIAWPARGTMSLPPAPPVTPLIHAMFYNTNRLETLDYVDKDVTKNKIKYTTQKTYKHDKYRNLKCDGLCFYSISHLDSK